MKWLFIYLNLISIFMMSWVYFASKETLEAQGSKLSSVWQLKKIIVQYFIISPFHKMGLFWVNKDLKGLFECSAQTFVPFLKRLFSARTEIKYSCKKLTSRVS